MAVSLFHPFSKSCLTSLKSMSSVLKTTKQNSTHIHAHYTHTLGSTKGNGIPSPSPICTIYWFCDPCRITSILRSFLICETETTMCLDCRIVRIKWNYVHDSTLYTIKHAYCYIIGTQTSLQSLPLASLGLSFTEKVLSSGVVYSMIQGCLCPNSSPPVPRSWKTDIISNFTWFPEKLILFLIWAPCPQNVKITGPDDH